jgi:hypothetical protein
MTERRLARITSGRARRPSRPAKRWHDRSVTRIGTGCTAQHLNESAKIRVPSSIEKIRLVVYPRKSAFRRLSPEIRVCKLKYSQ